MAAAPGPQVEQPGEGLEELVGQRLFEQRHGLVVVAHPGLGLDQGGQQQPDAHAPALDGDPRHRGARLVCGDLEIALAQCYLGPYGGQQRLPGGDAAGGAFAQQPLAPGQGEVEPAGQDQRQQCDDQRLEGAVAQVVAL